MTKKSIIGFQLQSIVKIIKEIKNKKKYHNDLFKDFKYFIKSSSFITINQKINSNANEEKSHIF